MHGTTLMLTQGVLRGSSGHYYGLPSRLGTSRCPHLSRSSLANPRQLYFDADSSQIHIHALR